MTKNVSTESQEAASRPSALDFIKQHIFDVAAYSGLIITVVLFLIFSENLAYNFGNILQSAAVYSVMACGAVFVYSMGNMDVSIGQQVGVYAILIIMISNAMGGVAGIVVGFLVALAIALLCGAFNGYVAVMLGLPSIVTSLFLMFFFTGAQLLLMESTGTNAISNNMIRLDRSVLSVTLVVIIAVVALLVWYFFKFTKLGKYTRAIGANETVAKQSGINTTKWKVIAYMALGACVATASLVMLMRTGSAGQSTGTGYAMDVMICLILGGMPLSGGMRSKVSAALVGTFTYSFLGMDLTLMGVGLNMVPFVKAVIFLVVVLVTCRRKGGVLPR